jgi:alpha-galactosidase
MDKITFMGAGSTIFVKNVLGDVLLTPALRGFEIALYDIDKERLDESYQLICALNKNCNQGRASIKKYLGAGERKDALRGARFVVNAIQIGGYDPCTITDFEVPKKYGLCQTIADTLGIGGIFRALRTIPVMKSFADDMEEVCPDAWLLNYTNPMAMLSGYMQRFTKIKTVGLCHSVQICAENLLKSLDMDEYVGKVETKIAGINHMAWLLEIKDENGNDIYPEIKRRAAEKNKSEKHSDMVRFEYINMLGYYCTESSEHNAEYTPFFIKGKYPELIDAYNIPLDEYPRRCVSQIEGWKKQSRELLNNKDLTHKRSNEYASYIMEAMVTGIPYKIGGNVLNGGLITNLPDEACVEVPCLVDRSGVTPCKTGALPTQLAAMNVTNVNVQLLTLEAAVTLDRQKIYQAAMMDPHTGAELSIGDIVRMCDDLIEAHKGWLPEYK